MPNIVALDTDAVISIPTENQASGRQHHLPPADDVADGPAQECSDQVPISA